jgi:hypothetical protein
VRDPFGDIDAELGEQAPDHVHQLRALGDEAPARSAQALGRWLVEFYLSDDMLENVEMMCPLR